MHLDLLMNKNKDRSQSTKLLRNTFVKNIRNQSSPKALSSHSTNFMRDMADLRKSSLTPQEENNDTNVQHHKRDGTDFDLRLRNSDLNKEFEIAFSAAVRNSQITHSAMSNQSPKNRDGVPTQEEDIIDDYDDEQNFKSCGDAADVPVGEEATSEDCNVIINDDDNGSFMPLTSNSHNSHDGNGSFNGGYDGSGGSTPRDDEEFEDLPDDVEEVVIDQLKSQHGQPARPSEETKSPDRRPRTNTSLNNTPLSESHNY